VKATWLLSPFLVVACAGCSAATKGPTRGDSARETAPAGTSAGSSAAGPSLSTTDNPAALPATAAAIGGNGASSDAEKCGEHHFDLERKPAELLLVLDRSASMKDAPSGASSSTPKWDLLVPAVNEVINATDASVSWGVKMFPEGTGSECDASAVTDHIDVDVAAMNAPNVAAAVTSSMPEGNGTPTADAIDRGLAYLRSRTSDNPKYILLATDGEPSCPKPSDDARTLAVKAVANAAAAGIHTFVVGVATTKSSATTALSDMAIAGMEARNEDPNPLATRYYLANTKDELVASLKQITGQISGCTFSWDQPPPVPGNIAVKVGGAKAPRDSTEGWEYVDRNYKSIEVHGSWCDKIKTTGANVVEIVFGCPDVEIL
jgi:hypothetical protein